MKDNITIMKGGEPFFARGGETGVVCFHGFTASPNEVLWLAKHLVAQGHTVYAPRLPGHGTQPQDLSRIHWRDWHAAALDSYHLMRQQCERVYVCGLSMGGLLALLTSMSEPVEGVVVLASPLVLGGVLRPGTLRAVKYFRPYTDQTDRTPFAQYIEAEQARRGEPVLGRVRYGIWSTAAVEQLARLIEHVIGRLGEVTAPLLAVYSEGDETVKLASRDVLRAGIESKNAEFITLKKSGHILTQDTECEDVFGCVAEFINASYR